MLNTLHFPFPVVYFSFNPVHPWAYSISGNTTDPSLDCSTVNAECLKKLHKQALPVKESRKLIKDTKNS